MKQARDYRKYNVRLTSADWQRGSCRVIKAYKGCCDWHTVAPISTEDAPISIKATSISINDDRSQYKSCLYWHAGRSTMLRSVSHTVYMYIISNCFDRHWVASPHVEVLHLVLSCFTRRVARRSTLIIPLLHTDHESHESLRIDKF